MKQQTVSDLTQKDFISLLEDRGFKNMGSLTCAVMFKPIFKDKEFPQLRSLVRIDTYKYSFPKKYTFWVRENWSSNGGYTSNNLDTKEDVINFLETYRYE